MEHIVKILSIRHITHDVVQIETEKPIHYEFIPGQATDISINREGLKQELRPFTFTSLPGDDHLQFTIKTYPERNGVTKELLNLRENDELIVHDIFGDIRYKGDGIFIAGGAGITPFISIFKQLVASGEIYRNKLVFANRTKADIIHEERFRNLLGADFVNVLSEEKAEGYAHGYVTEELLKPLVATEKYVYVCAPPPMTDAVIEILKNLKVPESLIIQEGF